MTTVLFWDIDGTLLTTARAGLHAWEEGLAERVGPTGRVFANDVQPQMLNILARRLNKDRIPGGTVYHR